MKILTEIISKLESGSRPKGGVTSVGDIPSLGAEHLDNYGGFSFKNVKRVSKEFYNSLKSGKLYRNDILIVKDGATTGKVSYLSEDFPFVEASINEHVFRIKINDQIAFSKYVFHFLKSSVGNRQIMADFRGATVGGISRKFTDGVAIPLPSLKKQKRIATILDHADSIRRKNRQILEKYNELAQSAFYEMFGDPVKNPFNYQITTLKEICCSIKDGPHLSPKYVKIGIPFISVNNIIKGFWDFSNLKFVSQADHEIFKRKCHPQKGDVLYSKGGTTGFAKYIDIELEFSNWVHIAVLKFDKERINGRFLESMLNSPFCYQQSQILTRGIANRDLVLGQMGKIKLLIPPIKTQKKFTDFIESLEMQKVYTKKGLGKSEELFQSLLQRAFKGDL